MGSPESFKPSAVLRGVAALQDALSLIRGDLDEANDGEFAKIIIENELDIRTMIRFALSSLTV